MQNGHNMSGSTVMPVLFSSGEIPRMHDLWVAYPASCPHETSFLHLLLHSPRGASLHPPRTLSPYSGFDSAELLDDVCVQRLMPFFGL